ncbi:hypothetical protein CI238_04354 [Colletotrichum incanum]|uniref:Uncharacterized protein n=1 Tax=Colletotrichum incanum TaxID=1573173 RepID=A0A166VC55_COLIC|nr:hypothetical protein CI238_04354 [Colletotrichum incanum]
MQSIDVDAAIIEQATVATIPTSAKNNRNRRNSVSVLPLPSPSSPEIAPTRTRARRNTTIDHPAPGSNAFGKPTGLRRSARPAATVAKANIKTHAHDNALMPGDAIDNASKDAPLPEEQDCNCLTPMLMTSPNLLLSGPKPQGTYDCHTGSEGQQRSQTHTFRRNVSFRFSKKVKIYEKVLTAGPGFRNKNPRRFGRQIRQKGTSHTKYYIFQRGEHGITTAEPQQISPHNIASTRISERGLEYKKCKARALHARNAAENDVEFCKLMLQGMENLAGDNLGYDERFRIWNNSAVEACETKDFRRNLKKFLAQNNDFLDKYRRYNQIRDREQLIWDQETKQRQVPEKAVGSLSMMIEKIKMSLDHNIALLDQVQLEYRAPDLETLAGIPIRQTMARTKLAEADDRLVAAQEWVESLIWRVDKSYPEWYWKWKKSAPDALH